MNNLMPMDMDMVMVDMHISLWNNTNSFSRGIYMHNTSYLVYCNLYCIYMYVRI